MLARQEERGALAQLDLPQPVVVWQAAKAAALRLSWRGYKHFAHPFLVFPLNGCGLVHYELGENSLAIVCALTGDMAANYLWLEVLMLAATRASALLPVKSLRRFGAGTGWNETLYVFLASLQVLPAGPLAPLWFTFILLASGRVPLMFPLWYSLFLRPERFHPNVMLTLFLAQRMLTPSPISWLVFVAALALVPVAPSTFALFLASLEFEPAQPSRTRTQFFVALSLLIHVFNHLAQEPQPAQGRRP